ncbi:MAG: ferrous iron transport protein A [Halanaerobiales bacterium]
MIYLTLNQLKKSTPAVVVDLKGGHHLTKKLNAMGIRVGKEVTKVSDSFFRGPVTLEIDRAKVAIGHGMADKILVKLVE